MSFPDIYFVPVRGIEVFASIGIHAFEKVGPQKLHVSVTLILPEPTVLGDDVGNVVNYDFVREGVLRLARDRRYNLQETLCQEILDVCLGDAGVLGAVVQTDKPDVYPAVAGVGCRMARLRPSLAGFPWWSLPV